MSSLHRRMVHRGNGAPIMIQPHSVDGAQDGARFARI